MASRKPKVRSAGFSISEQVPELTKKDWFRIQRRYPHKLTVELREKITNITLNYAVLGLITTEAATISDSRAALNKVKTIAKELFNIVEPSDQSGQSALGYARQVINNFMRNANPPSVNSLAEPIRDLSEKLQQCIDACEHGSVILSNPDYMMKESQPFQQWIHGLTKLLNEFDLPTTVSKAKDRFDKPSDFVSLVFELQTCLPQTCRRHMGSLVALAKAISLARRHAADADRSS